MAVYMLIFLTALMLAVGGTPAARWIAPRLGFMDLPGARRVHRHPIPRLGGAAIYLAAIVALLIFGEQFSIPQAVGVLLGATLVSFFGLWDDRRSLSPALKLLGQFVAAGILLMTNVRVGIFPYQWLNAAITLVWVIGITNAMNLLDNMDGLSGGVGAVASTFFLLLAAMNGQFVGGALSAAVLGACVGFLVYNLNPASIIMGDSGALFLGFMLASVGIKLRFPENVYIVTWMVPILILGVPIFDTTLVVVSRLLRRVNPLTTPGKDHLSHRLVNMGFTQREAVMILYLVGGALGLLAVFVTQATILEGYAVGVMVVLSGIVALVALERRYRATKAGTTGKEMGGESET
ncbi:MAG: undecaprenyl/decaprenyl-phosphate alpha-N-acetylglucosaminyl 1-phosphate transferase [Anaerolineae bacterium]|nr:MAG: undecaprenyl/decaprenyl-phosphate alpha-N-acetylglucosaminyl 1-phosphate transferase [Anaerolineae bacterium]